MAKYWSDLVGGLVRDWLMITPFSRRVGNCLILGQKRVCEEQYFRTEIPCVPGPQTRGAEGTPSWLEDRGGLNHSPYT